MNVRAVPTHSRHCCAGVSEEAARQAAFRSSAGSRCKVDQLARVATIERGLLHQQPCDLLARDGPVLDRSELRGVQCVTHVRRYGMTMEEDRGHRHRHQRFLASIAFSFVDGCGRKGSATDANAIAPWPSSWKTRGNAHPFRLRIESMGSRIPHCQGTKERQGWPRPPPWLGSCDSGRLDYSARQ